MAAHVESYFTGLDLDYLITKYEYEQKVVSRPSPKVKEKISRGSSLPPPERVLTTPRNISINHTYKEHNDGEGKTAAAEFFEHALRELEGTGVSPEQLELGREYLIANETLIRKKDNPVGYFIASVKKGWAADRMKLPRQEREREEAAEQLLEKRRAAVQNLLQAYEGKEEGFTISADPYRVTFIYLKQYLPAGETNTYFPIGFKDPQFETLLTKQQEKIDACIRNSRKSHSMDESGKKRK